MKDLIFGRIKACDIVQTIYFVVETLELYYTQKLLNIANNRLESNMTYCMPVRNEPNGLRMHSLSVNVKLGQQNVRKWYNTFNE